MHSSSSVHEHETGPSPSSCTNTPLSSVGSSSVVAGGVVVGLVLDASVAFVMPDSPELLAPVLASPSAFGSGRAPQAISHTLARQLSVILNLKGATARSYHRGRGSVSDIAC